MTDSDRQACAWNVKWYPRYAFLSDAYFWLPIFFLYFSKELTLDEVLLVEMIYYLGVYLMEVPSGWFSDRFGRRITLLVAAVVLAVAYGMIFLGSTFLVFGIAQFLKATGISFKSGTETAFHFDSLKILGREDEFAAREAKVSRNRFLGGALAALIGGLVAIWSLQSAYLVACICAIGMILLVVRFSEPKIEEDEKYGNPLREFGKCIAYLKQPILLAIMGYFILMTILNHVPYEFFQPYIELSLVSYPWAQPGTPFVSGVHVTLTLLVASFFGARSIRIRDRIGLWWTLLVATVLQVLIIGVMGWFLAPLVVLLLLARSVPRALMAPVINAAVTGRVARKHRATYLSMQSLAGRLAFAGMLLLLTTAVPSNENTTWNSLSSALRLSFWIALGGLAIVIVVAVLRSKRDGTGEAAPS
ncbi:MAG: MFS transporter [Phycisphaerales bacterium]|nr:MFS transporter [Phycisphaerales bacterium]